jgi:phosphoribosylglycinamide formyltransferase-1
MVSSDTSFSPISPAVPPVEQELLPREKLKKKGAKKIKLAVLVSGRGSNLQAIIDAIKHDKLDAEIKIVISNIENAFALERAKKTHIITKVVNDKLYPTRQEFEEQIMHILFEHDIDLVCLAGFMKVLSPFFISHFRGRIMNIHPALLPAFPGLHSQKQALDYGVKYAGATVHFVDESVDCGPIILQAVVPVLDEDSEEILSNRILEQEHRIYSEAIQLFAEGKLDIEGRKVRIK